ncbi:type III pantothenate kinase [Haploplasma axanthum]|uniref:Type III pantothenate kinase n=1 Tax=Haploplasma axanthum TaxID=29552 RepID=A0A449BE79_HAPAX|nr:type III pantothenate kinase [Haploplasma axanthum]VEU80764.1 putative transcriptional regulator [Haploplasma axanthum]
MILLFDVGNTTVGIATSHDGKIGKTFKLNTNLKKTADEYFLDIKQLISAETITDVIISSVVPRLTIVLTELSEKFFSVEPLVIQPKTKTGIKIITDNPKEVGADIICAAAGVLNKEKPSLIIDLGTATKYIYTKNNAIKGVIITPGIKISIKALVGNTALLPEIDIETPKKVLGTNTIECMQSGVTYGVAVQVDGLIDLIKKEVNEDFDVIITGGLAKKIIPLLTHKVIVDNDIIFKGLINIYEKNMR